ncbi:MAG: plasmid pRiA4b ORF-3 family protein [Methanobrevibacter sp.]|jgi:hypothetical protein|nr:plasmid pRiA4b ORF-3 family protein [Candidatus Methanoflexus mossambicus]
MSNEIAVMRIKLKDTHIPIRRWIEIDPNISLHEFHEIIQTVMGWGNYHLYGFFVGEHSYFPEDAEMDFGNKISKIEETNLKDILNITKKFSYEYDFGDSWEHEIVLNRYVDKKEGVNYPRCVAAKGMCPPEDIGGVWGYARFLDETQWKNPTEEYLETIEHYGYSLEEIKNVAKEDPDIKEINYTLNSVGYY